MTIDWTKVPNFSPSEFREEELKFLAPDMLYKLQQYRSMTKLPIYPSPVPGAIARFDGDPDNQHYAVNRLSTATDVFLEGMPFKNFLTAINSNLFMGVGFYLDTVYNNESWVMFHFDTRMSGYEGRTLVWYRDEVGNYHYPQRGDSEFSIFYSTLCRNHHMIVPKHKRKSKREGY